jgi:DNA-directed RNA polymerase specialized sigma24 family protein
VDADVAPVVLLRSSRRSWRERSAVRAALRGDAAGVDWLFHEHWPAAYRAAWLIVRDESAAEDIAQEGFLAALGALERFDRARPFGPWLRTIVARRAIDAARARAVRREVGAEPLRAWPTTCWPPWRCSPTSSGSRSRCATCSASRPARSRSCSACPAEP